MKITKRAIDALAATEGVAVIRDEVLRGFGARRNGNGSISYFFEYRPGAGGRGAPVRRMVLKVEPPVTPDRARAVAELLYAEVIAGGDPAAKRSARRKEMTVAALLRDVLETHWRVKCKASTANEFARTIERDLIPTFGDVRISELARADVRRWHALNAHRPRQANHSLAVLRKAFNVAIGDDLLQSNPCTNIGLHREQSRDRVLSTSELRRLWQAISVTPKTQPGSQRLFSLLLLTGLRTSEWADARWVDLDTEQGLLRLIDSKIGARVVALSGPVLQLLAGFDRDSEYVCPNADGCRRVHPSVIAADWRRICTAAGLSDLRVHDLRHTFATIGAALGGSALVLRDALGHRTVAMTSRYVARQDSAVRALSERVAGRLLDLPKP